MAEVETQYPERAYCITWEGTTRHSLRSGARGGYGAKDPLPSKTTFWRGALGTTPAHFLQNVDYRRPLRARYRKPSTRDNEHENVSRDPNKPHPRRGLCRRRPSTSRRHDQDRRDQLLFGDPLLHRTLSQGLAARARGDQRGRRRRRQETRGD